MPPLEDLLPSDLPQRMHKWTELWHADPATAAPEDLFAQLHRANFDLWHLEDRARDPQAGSDAVAEVKRGIDRVNQRRNDLVEQIDASLLSRISGFGLPRASAPLHSETPGLMADRLSILTLKQVHTAEQISRADASPEHIARNRERLALLDEQTLDLAACLAELWRQVVAGERRFKLYRQLKMYNDPTLNPVLYAATSQSRS